jgi:hypothetical protein
MKNLSNELAQFIMNIANITPQQLADFKAANKNDK